MKMFICFDDERYLQFYSEERYRAFCFGRTQKIPTFDVNHDIVFLWSEFFGVARYPRYSNRIEAAKTISRRMKWELRLTS